MHPSPGERVVYEIYYGTATGGGACLVGIYLARHMVGARLCAGVIEETPYGIVGVGHARMFLGETLRSVEIVGHNKRMVRREREHRSEKRLRQSVYDTCHVTEELTVAYSPEAVEVSGAALRFVILLRVMVLHPYVIAESDETHRASRRPAKKVGTVALARQKRRQPVYASQCLRRQHERSDIRRYGGHYGRKCVDRLTAARICVGKQ